LLEIGIESPDQPAVVELLDAGDAYVAALYPAESNHMLDVPALKKPGAVFVVARDNGQVVGCAALVNSGGGWAEIKRMFVAPVARGQQIGRKLLQKIEAIATERGVTLLRLETGVKQPQALSLYRSAGYIDIGPFGQYAPDPLSVFMEKSVAIASPPQAAGRDDL
jgi:putative acetyltransferase